MIDLAEFAERGAIDPARMRAVDRNAVALGLSSLQMMEAAGAALARGRARRGAGRRAGAGRAREQRRGRSGRGAVPRGRGRCRGDRRRRRDHAGDGGAGGAPRPDARAGPPGPCPSELGPLGTLFEEADLVIDALLGVGATPPLREPVAAIVGAGERRARADPRGRRPDAGMPGRPGARVPPAEGAECDGRADRDPARGRDLCRAGRPARARAAAAARRTRARAGACSWSVAGRTRARRISSASPRSGPGPTWSSSRPRRRSRTRT